MPNAQITNPYGAFGQPGAGVGGGYEGALTVEAQTRSTALDPASAGSTDGNFRTIKAGMVVTGTFPSSSFYPQGLAVAAATGPGQLPFGIATENITAFWGSTGSTGAVKVQSPNNQVGGVAIYGVVYAMFASTAHPGAGDVGIPAYVTIATTSQSLFNASCHFGLCSLSSGPIVSSTIASGGITPSTLQNVAANVVGIAFTSQGGQSVVTSNTSGPQLYPIYAIKQI